MTMSYRADLHPTRRTLLTGAAAAAAILSIGARGATRLPPGLFSLGVASGDPMADRVVLWTRLAPVPLAGDGGMPPVAIEVRWEVAEDARFARIVRAGVVLAQPARGHAVHIDAAGLRPARRYFYRFIAGGETSPVGRTRTAPEPGAPVDRLRVCFGSCQKYEAGQYAAYRHMIAEDPDLILFLGDYIYEGAPSARNAVRLHQNPEPLDLAGYRVRYATYKSDPLLQAAHHAAPWALTWDDHEVANDYGAARDENNGDPVRFLLRRAAAYQAYYEHLPLRAATRAWGEERRIYRTLDWGSLAQFQILDDRQYRGLPACQPDGLAASHQRYRSLIDACPELGDPQRTMLGRAQEQWLMARLGDSAAQWNVLAQQTLMHQQARIDAAHPERGKQYGADTWSGFPAARDRIFRRWAEARTRNPLALGGDIHAFAAADIRDPARPDGAPIAAEFVGGSITSLLADKGFKQLAAANGLGFAEDAQRGYGRLDLTPAGGAVTFRGLADSRLLGSAIADIAHFPLEPNRPGLPT
ncbi:alkaline phosphatase D family protein [Sphingomonas hylomeconis]|uniref:Alkaline phosphatase D family protein n=1 Tax=Sphingomonas hylomeconis TaxID=1395958 RepID=A0ABV7SUE8_9SPHN|nr:alkaline phosphatase D family protein [Sphingomonas hylomeconis]